MLNFKWLYPGLRVKRWVLVAGVGLFFLVAGLTLTFGITLLAYAEWSLTWFILQTLGRLGSPLTGGIISALGGLILLIWGLQQLTRSVVGVFIPEPRIGLLETLYRRRYLERGPRVVAIGGGTGLAVLLRGLKKYTRNLTALVTVADDGGSSGRLRADLGIPPPGDVRNCLVALAETESLMEDLLNYRFQQGAGLAGHSLGNLLLAAVTDLAGDFDRAIQELSKVLALGGRVLPSSLTTVNLGAEFDDGTVVWGESKIPAVGKKIKRVFLQPENCVPPQAALEAIATADVIVIGPGSLYTSILPNLLVPGVAEAVRRSPALTFYVCNLMTQPGETDGYTAADHLQAIFDHCGAGLVDYIIVHSGPVSRSLRRRYQLQGASLVEIDPEAIKRLGVQLLRGWLIEESQVVRHHPERLARLILEEMHRYRRRRRSFWGVIGWHLLFPTGQKKNWPEGG
ncbi:MAG: hypothetical protein PWP65_1086 [Clostridia bacterium]|nr:hypothetical protein [Clostridia bacterium]